MRDGEMSTMCSCPSGGVNARPMASTDALPSEHRRIRGTDDKERLS